MAPSGNAWRCAIAPAALFSENGLAVDQSGGNSVLCVTYTSASVDEFFNWTDAKYETPSGLARLFIKRFPKLVALAKGSDWTYAGWYIEMLGLTYPDLFPFAFADWDGPEDLDARASSWRTTIVSDSNSVNVNIPFPPAKVQI